MPGQTSFSAELFRSKNGDDRLYHLIGNHGELDPALLDVEYGIGRIALREDKLIRAVMGYGSPSPTSARKDLGSNGDLRFMAITVRPGLSERSSTEALGWRWR
jgi:hypothetical protein